MDPFYFAILFCAGICVGASFPGKSKAQPEKTKVSLTFAGCGEHTQVDANSVEEAEELLQRADARRPAQAPEGPPDTPES